MIETWQPFAVDGSSYGLVMLAAYAATVWSCARAARQCPGHPRYRQGGAGIRTMRRERLLWQAIAALLAMLAAYRGFNLAGLITELGRTIAVYGQWYGHRRPFQMVMLGTVAIAVILSAAVVLRLVFNVNPLALIAVAASTALVLLFGINVLSLHWMDAFLRSGFGRANIYNATESGSVAAILAASLWYGRQTSMV